MSKPSARIEHTGRTSCLAGGGEAGARLRAIDWRATPLGPLERWPASLRAAVAVVLAAPAPMCLVWGSTRTLLYNDAFAASRLVAGYEGLARPAGQALAPCWTELAPLCDRVHAFGDALEHALAGEGADAVAIRLAPVEGKAGETSGVLLTVAAPAPADADERVALLSQAASELLAAEDPDGMVFALFERMAQHLGLDAFFNFMVDEQGDALRLVAYAGIPAEEAERIRRLEYGQAVCGTAARERRTIPAAHIQASDEPMVQLVKGYGLRAYVCHPLIVDGELLGTLSFASRTRERFDEDEVAFLGTIAHYVAIAKQRLKTLKVLRRREQDMRLVADATPALIAFVDKAQRYRFANKAYEEWFGARSGGVLGRTVAEVIGAEAYDTIRADVEAALAGREARYERWVPYASGPRFVQARLSPRFEPDGSVEGFFVFVTDMTARRRTEERLRHTYENAPLAIAEFDLDGRLLAVNARFPELTGYSRGELLGMRLLDLAHPNDRAGDRERFRLLQTGQAATYHGETRYRRKDGTSVWVGVRAALVSDERGRPQYGIAIVENITARKLAEQALRASEERHRRLMGLLPAAVYTCDAAGRITYFNRRAAELWGREPAIGEADERFCGSYRLWLPDGRALPHAETPMARAVREGRAARNAEVVIERPDGSRVTVSVNIDPLYDGESRVAGAINVFQDITAIKQAEADLRAREAELRIVTDSTPALIAYVDRNRTYRFANKVYEDWFGLAPGEVVGRTVPEVLGDAAYERLRGYVDRALAGEAVDYETQVPYRRGGTRWVKESYVPDRGPDGEVKGFFALVSDLTARKQAEDALRDSEERLRLALAAARMGTWTREFGPEGERVVWSPELEAIFGLAPGEFPGTREAYLALVHPDDRERINRVVAEAIERRQDYEIEFRYRPKGGGERWMLARGRPYFDGDGRLVRLAGVGIDVTEDKLAQESLRRSEAAARAHLTEIEAIYHSAPVGLGVLDRELRFVRINQRLAEINGIPAERHAGRTLREILPHLADQAEPPMRRVIETGEPVLGTEVAGETAARPGVARHWIEHCLPLRDAAGLVVGVSVVVEEITERKRAEELLKLRVREQQAVARLGHAALETDDLQAVFDMTVRLVAETLEADYAKVLELDPGGSALTLRAGVGWREGLVGRARVSAGLESQAGYTLVANAPVVVEDLRAETRFPGPPLLHDHGVTSGMSVVLAEGPGRPYGVLGVHTRAPRRFSPEDVSFFESVGHVLSAAIQRHRALRDLQQARDELERRVEERTTELARLNQSLRDEIVERMGVEAALRDSEAQYRLLFERNPLPAWVFDLDTHEILAANETAVWKYGYTREDLLRMRIDELHPPEDLARPLDYTERFPPETAYMGAWRHRKHDDTVVDVELFAYEVLFRGRWARLVLANDITERKRAEQEGRVLESIARAVAEAADVDEALHAVLYHVCHATGWVLGEAWIPAADGTRFVKSPAWFGAMDEFGQFAAQSAAIEFRPAEGMIGRAWTTRQPVWVPDVTLDVNFLRAEPARAAGLRSGMAFPVVAGADVVAILAFFLKDERREDEQLVKLVATVAAHVGLAIQRKHAEERLRESEERFRWLVEGAHDYALYMLDPDGRIASWNRGAQRLKGYAEDEVLGRYYSMFFTEDDVRRLLPQRALDRAAAEGVYESEGWRVRKDGSRFWASSTVTALRDASGTLRGFVKVTRDITERREAEERLRESEARLQRAQEFSLLMVAHTALDGRWLKVPPMLCALLGYTEEELLAGRFRDVTHPDDFEPEWALCQRLIRGEAKSFDIEKRFLRRDGKVVWVYQNTSVVLGPEDRPLHFLTFVRDITERREAEEQLRKSELQLSEAQRLAHLGSWEWNIAAGHVEWSDELYRIYGIDPGTPISFETYIGCVHPDDRERVKDVVTQAIRSREPFTMEERIVRGDGELRHLLSQGALIMNAKGEVARMVGVCLDITERKRAEERLREYAGRLQGLSLRLLEAQETERRRIARELHDQIGQDLSVIKINLQTLKRLPGSASLGNYIDETIRVVEGVLATARNLSLELRPSMLDDLGLAAALRWYLDRQAQRAGFSLHFEAEAAERRVPPAIETACFRLAQEAVTNVMRHARASQVDVALELDEQALRMRIADDGEGFDVEAARARAARGESFGILGMEERTLLAGGRLEIISAPGQGTEVQVHFPLSGDHP